MTLEICKVTKSYGKYAALHDISLTLDRGVIAVLGANGSGKTTLLRLLATLDHPDRGFIRWGGLNYSTHRAQIRPRIGYLPQTLELPQHLTPYSLLCYLARMRRTPLTDVDKIMDQLSLNTFARKRLSKLSGGQLRLVGLAQALIGPHDMLVLDEPRNGLGVTEWQRVIRLLPAQDKIVVFSTHLPEDAERIAQTVIVLHQGQVLFCGMPLTLKSRVFHGASDRPSAPMHRAPDHRKISLEEAYLHLLSEASWWD